ncbi:MAG TPA: hemolysin III family protein [Acidimicrobiia bacterium]|nr:hemolysin III family protein [Acidimicrobiia bacterium]
MDRITWGRMQNPLRGLLHGLGAVAASCGLVALIVQARDRTSILAAVAIFGGSLVAMFTVSALYHSVPWSRPWKQRMQRVDHSLIFVVVAATFTPVAVAALDGSRRVIGLALVWGIGAVGVILKFVLDDERTWLSITLQMVMGVSSVLWLPLISRRLGWGAVILILGGGAAYVVGTVVFASRRPNPFPRLFGYHELFHVLVMVGAGLHFWAIAGYVA